MVIVINMNFIAHTGMAKRSIDLMVDAAVLAIFRCGFFLLRSYSLRLERCLSFLNNGWTEIMDEIQGL